MDNFNLLKNKIKTKSLSICIIGQGYIGLPLSLAFADCGFKVLGYDINEEKVQRLNKGISGIGTVSSSTIEKCIKDKKISFTSRIEDTKSCEIYIICVPTPLGKHREPDLRAVKDAYQQVANNLNKNDVVCLESTTYPGTTEELYQDYIYAKGLEAGEDVFVIFSPEREDPGNKKFSTTNIPKILGGVTQKCKEIGYQIYNSIIDEVVLVKDCRTAEMTKLLENVHRCVNIGLVNELKPLADIMDIDIYEVIKAAATKPFGFVPYYPGPGLGGHCIPIDPFYLSWKAKEYGMNTRFIELAGEINKFMPHYVVSKLIEVLNTQEKALKNSKILVVGISYKKNIDDIRESPAIEIINLLSKQFCQISVYDPIVNYLPNSIKKLTHQKIKVLSKEELKSYDGILIITDHDQIDYDMIKTNSKLIIDTRGRYEVATNIFRA